MTLSQLTLRAQQQAVEKVSITPAMAKAWLAQGDPNRVLKPSDIAKIANDIRCGAWQYNGQPIIFSGKRLIDGQHRLHAIVLTGIPVASLIVRDVEPEAMSVIDSGVARTAVDVAHLHHVESAPKSVAITRRLQWLRDGSPASLSGSAVLRLYEEFKSDVEWAVNLPSRPPKKSAAFTAAFAFARRTNPAIVEDAAERFFGEVGLRGGSDPIRVLHVYAGSSVGRIEAQTASSLAVSLKVLRAIKAEIDGEPIAALMTKSGVLFEVVRADFAQKWVAG